MHRFITAARFPVALGVALTLIGLHAGCSRGPTSPTPPPEVTTPPPPPPQPPPPVQFSLSGRIVDLVYRPLADVRVEIIEGPGLGLAAMTDASGDYAFPAIFADAVTVRVSKADYATQVRTSPRSLPPNSDRVSMSFILDGPAVDMAGEYTLTIAGDGCQELPPEARRRTYDATMTPLGGGMPNAYRVTLSGVTFKQPYNSMLASVAGDVALFHIDSYDVILVTEELTPTTALTVWGSGRGVVKGPTITVPFEAGLQYCADYRGPAPRFPFYQCGVPPIECNSPGSTLTLTRR